jgi:adenine/guanine phosphoribosyltransferase-like PRPP-binding protein
MTIGRVGDSMSEHPRSRSLTSTVPAADARAGTEPVGSLTDSRVLELLRRGVASAASLSFNPEVLDQAGAVRQMVLETKYSGLSDPAGVEELGRELASRLARTRPEVLLVWQDVEDLVLGYVVARALGVTMVRAYDAEGIVACSGEIGNNVRAVAVTDTVRDPTVMRALRSLVERSGGELVAIGTLVASPLTPTDIEVMALTGSGGGVENVEASGAERTSAR